MEFVQNGNIVHTFSVTVLSSEFAAGLVADVLFYTSDGQLDSVKWLSSGSLHIVLHTMLPCVDSVPIFP